MKAFAIFLTELNEGSTHAAITGDLAELLRTVQATGRAGSLTDDGETTRNHPRQHDLPLRDVAQPAPINFKEA